MEQTNEFDWNPLGESWWIDTAKQLGATPRQAKFACAKTRGCSNTESARQAGYGSGTDDQNLRSTGYRLSRSNMVGRLLALASGAGSGYDGAVDRDEARRILSNLARGSDPAIRIRSIEGLQKLDEADRQQQAAKEEPTLEDIARSMLEHSPEYAPVILADLVFKEGGQIWGLPFMEQLAPILKRDFPVAWEKYRAAMGQAEWRTEFESLSNGPALSIEQILAMHPKKSTNSKPEGN
jgi:hypothetical protein